MLVRFLLPYARTRLACATQVWVLTGDKQETAIEIAMTCRLITRRMHTIILNSEYARLHYDKGKTIATVAHHRAARREVRRKTLGSVSCARICSRRYQRARGDARPIAAFEHRRTRVNVDVLRNELRYPCPAHDSTSCFAGFRPLVPPVVRACFVGAGAGADQQPLGRN